MRLARFIEQSYSYFSPLDLEKILHAEQSTSKEEGWIFVKHSELYEVWRRVDPDRPVHLIKVSLTPNYVKANIQTTSCAQEKLVHEE